MITSRNLRVIKEDLHRDGGLMARGLQDIISYINLNVILPAKARIPCRLLLPSCTSDGM